VITTGTVFFTEVYNGLDMQLGWGEEYRIFPLKMFKDTVGRCNGDLLLILKRIQGNRQSE
jgi:hypothetical protein